MKVSEFLQTLLSYEMYDEPRLSEEFRKETGHEAGWPTTNNGPIQYARGYEVAMWCEEKFAGTRESHQFYGRGSQFRAALKALKEKGL